MKILIIRLDNIGDMILTLPSLQALYRMHDGVKIDVLGTDYNSSFLTGTPGINRVFSLKKTKHYPLLKLPLIIAHNHLLKKKARDQKYDITYAIGTSSKKLIKTARSISAKKTLLFNYEGKLPNFYSVNSPSNHRSHESHEIKKIFMDEFGDFELRPPILRPRIWNTKKELSVGIHLSARRAKQKLSFPQIHELIFYLLRSDTLLNIRITWSPGSSRNKRHPGDDELSQKLNAIYQNSKRVEFCRTESIDSLIKAFEKNSLIICSDGGAMHIASALNCKIVALFGDSDHTRWGPFCHHYKIIRSDSVDQIDTTEIYNSTMLLFEK